MPHIQLGTASKLLMMLWKVLVLHLAPLQNSPDLAIAVPLTRTSSFHTCRLFFIVIISPFPQLFFIISPSIQCLLFSSNVDLLQKSKPPPMGEIKKSFHKSVRSCTHFAVAYIQMCTYPFMYMPFIMG